MSKKIYENSKLKSIQSFKTENINEAKLFKGGFTSDFFSLWIKSPKKYAKSLS